MPGPEANVWARLRKSLPSKSNATRIENRHGGGIPDVHITVPECSFWVELKADNRLSPTLRPQQAAWHLREARCGGLSYVLCGSPVSPTVKIWRGSAASLAGSAGLSCVPALIEATSMAEALRLLLADALRLQIERGLAASRSLGPGSEKAPDA